MSNNPKIELNIRLPEILSGGEPVKLRPVELNLEEGISRISEADVKLISTSSAMSDINVLDQLLGQNATVVMRQEWSRNKKIERYFRGIITGVEHCGVYAKDTYSCRLTIQAPVINLCYSAQAARYTDKSLRELIQRFSGQCGYASVEFDTESNDESLLNVKRVFQQGTENDYDFFCKLLTEAGLCYLSYTPDESKDKPSEPVLRIYSKNNFSPVSHLITPKNFPNTYTTNGSTVDCLLMENWSCGNETGTNQVVVQGQNEDKFYARSAGDENGNTVLWNDNSYLTENLLQEMADNYLTAAKFKQSGCHADTYWLTAITGKQIQVRPFSDDEEIPVWITSATTAIKIAHASGGVDMDELLVSFSGIQNEVRAATVGNSGITDNNSACLHFVQAVVCDSSWNYSKNVGTSIQITENYTFNAVDLKGVKSDGTSTDDCKITVQYVMGNGGFLQGGFRVPRIGDRILITKCGATCFFAGYSPNKDNMPALPTTTPVKDNYDLNEMTTLRHVPSGSGDTAKDYLPPEIKLNEDAGYTVSGLTFCSGKKDTADLTSLVSVGNLYLSANHTQDICAPNVNFTTTQKGSGEILFDQAQKGIFEAAESIMFKVDHNVIVIDKSGIRLAARWFSNAEGPLNSTLTMNPIMGIDISGSNCQIKATTNVSLYDGTGAALQATAGQLSISGIQVFTRTKTTRTAVIQFASVLLKTIEQYANIGKNPDDERGWGNGMNGFDAFGITGQILDAMAWSFENEKMEVDYAFNDAQMFFSMIEQILLNLYIYFERQNASFLDKKYPGKGGTTITGRDAFMIAINSFFVLVWGMFTVIALVETPKFTSSALELAGDSISFENGNKTEATCDEKFSNGPLAGVELTEKGNKLTKALDYLMDVKHMSKKLLVPGIVIGALGAIGYGVYTAVTDEGNPVNDEKKFLEEEGLVEKK